MRTMSFVITAVLVLSSFGLAQVLIESHEIPLVIDTYGRFKQNQAIFMWTPFDSTRQVWDMTQYPGGYLTRTGLLPPEEGRYPAPDSMESDPPDPDVVSADTMGSGSEQWTFLYKTDFGLYLDGIDFDQGGYRFLGNYHPDARIYVNPMYYGAGWMSAITWQYELIPGIPYVANEQHTKRIVARGKVKVPLSGDYFWPCLVIKDYSVYTDNMGSEDRRWIYEWLVPGHFLGGNGVAAAMSQNGASHDFMNVEHMFQMSQADIPGWDLIPPEFANTTVWPDTDYAGPYEVTSTITDDDAVGAESLFYRVDQGSWISVGADSSNGDLYHFTIPEVTMPADVDYYVWAKDEFSVEDSIDCWTTWPVCSPESTMVSFLAASTGIAAEPITTSGPPGLTASPNPFRRSTRFALANAPTDRATVRIYSVAGELVATLALEPSNPGILSADWRGRSLTGSELPAGAYIFRVNASEYTETGKILLNR